MPMHLFRKSIDLAPSQVRLAVEADHIDIARLTSLAARRYYGLNNNDLPQLLATVPAAVLEAGHEVRAVALPGWCADQVTWLRCVAMERGLPTTRTVRSLLPVLHAELAARGLHQVYYAGDEAADIWLLPALRQAGYLIDTTVVVYEKHAMSVPTSGNRAVTIRSAVVADLADLVVLDRACFERHWVKNEVALQAAILERSFFVVARQARALVGYAYATSHFGGRLVHLVRIAARPAGQGIGARLLAELVAYARQQQADVITLNTQSYNDGAQRLYRWFGFTPNGESQRVLRFDL